jgi:hypothetical protein
MALNRVRQRHSRNVRRTIMLAVVLMAGAAPLGECTFPITIDCNTSDCVDPPGQGPHEPYFHVGGTVSLRTLAAADSGATFFARTGVLAPVDRTSTAAAPDIPGITTSGTGTVRENVTVPLYGGVTVPAKNFGVPVRDLSFEAFGGADIKNERTAFAVDEATGGYASGSKSYWEANPALGAGIQYRLGTVYGIPTSLGAAYIVDFQVGNHTATAVSPTVLGQVYSFTNQPHVNQTAAITLNFDLGPR